MVGVVSRGGDIKSTDVMVTSGRVWVHAPLLKLPHTKLAFWQYVSFLNARIQRRKSSRVEMKD